MRSPYPQPGLYREDLYLLPTPALVTGVPVFIGHLPTLPANLAPNTPLLLTQTSPVAAVVDGGVSGGSPLSKSSYAPCAITHRDDHQLPALCRAGFFENGGRTCYVLFLPALTLEALQAGLAALESLNTLDLICAPDIMRLSAPELILQMQLALLEHCDRLGDRFAILDSLPLTRATSAPALAAVAHQCQTLQRQSAHSPNGALYTPWLEVEKTPVGLTQPISAQPMPTAAAIAIPPCGHIAGLYAQGDRAVGVHHAPANQPVEGLLDVAVDLSPPAQRTLNADPELAAINCLQALPGRGIRVWGAHTLSDDSAWRYINVRRLVITIGRWLERNLADAAFEPNDFRLWVRLEREISAYLEGLFNQGAFRGSTPQDAFYVKCDGDTNPPESRETGTVVTEIGITPMLPSEVVVLRIVHGAAGVTLTTTS
ncbi:MAG: phage tail sheath family protein [Leptolyngbyaceae cyanobacterium SM2_5_2]|nr:phage tail sheath family protein [Leptolyngbyaceae cyanobacterium SM2_5_2]